LALAVGTAVKFTGLPKDHPLMNSTSQDGPNGPMGVVCGFSFYSPLGPNPQYAITCHAQGAIYFPIDGSNVVAAVAPNPIIPLPAAKTYWRPPVHHATS
jgi:hypothetical protein